MIDTVMRHLTDRLDVVETCTRMVWFADRREWAALAELLDDEVVLDYTSLYGGEPSRASREHLVDGWAADLSGYTATQHMVSNHLVTVEEDTARCTANFQATHVLPNKFGGSTWTIGGHYSYWLRRALEGWRITSVTMDVDWASGNQHISTVALAK